MGPAIRKKRLEIGLDASARAGLIADAFTGNEASQHRLMRLRWSEEINCEFIHGIPGGWSKNGQPCDKFHSMFRYLQDLFEAASLGHFSDVTLRARLETLLHGSKTLGSVKMSHEDSQPPSIS